MFHHLFTSVNRVKPTQNFQHEWVRKLFLVQFSLQRQRRGYKAMDTIPQSSQIAFFNFRWSDCARAYRVQGGISNNSTTWHGTFPTYRALGSHYQYFFPENCCKYLSLDFCSQRLTLCRIRSLIFRTTYTTSSQSKFSDVLMLDLGLASSIWSREWSDMLYRFFNWKGLSLKLHSLTTFFETKPPKPLGASLVHHGLFLLTAEELYDISLFHKFYIPFSIMSSRTSRFHHLHTTQLALPQANTMDHYAAMRDALPNSPTERNYIIIYHVHPDTRAWDINWIIEPENVTLSSPIYLRHNANLSTGDQVSTARPCCWAAAQEANKSQCQWCARGSVFCRDVCDSSPGVIIFGGRSLVLYFWYICFLGWNFRDAKSGHLFPIEIEIGVLEFIKYRVI